MIQDLVVQKPVNANLGLKFNQGPCFSYMYFKRVFMAKSKWLFQRTQVFM